MGRGTHPTEFAVHSMKFHRDREAADTYAIRTAHPVGALSAPGHAGLIATRRQIVERAEAFARAHVGSPMPLSTLCRVVGLSERGLRNAFYSVRGMSPTRCMRAERLQRVRRALSDSASGPNTVTSIAIDYGFYELGRFAAIYKEAFGEAPSETLRGTRGKPAARQR